MLTFTLKFSNYFGITRNDTFCFFFTHTIHSDGRLPSLHSSQLLPFHGHSPPVSTRPPFPFRKNRGVPGIPTECSITNCSNSKYKSSYQGWIRQPSSRKKVRKLDKRIRDTCSLTVRSPTKHKLKTIAYLQRIKQKPTQALASVSGNGYEPCLVNSVGLVLLTPLASTILPSPLLQDFPSSS